MSQEQGAPRHPSPQFWGFPLSPTNNRGNFPLSFLATYPHPSPRSDTPREELTPPFNYQCCLAAPTHGNYPLIEAGRYSPNQQVSRGKSPRLLRDPRGRGMLRAGAQGSIPTLPGPSTGPGGGSPAGAPSGLLPTPVRPVPSTVPSRRTNHCGRTSPGCGGPGPG